MSGALYRPRIQRADLSAKKHRRRTRKASRMYRNEDRTGALEEFKKADKQDGGPVLGVPAEDDQRHGPRRLGTVTRVYALHSSETNGYLRASRNRRSKVTRHLSDGRNTICGSGTRDLTR